jgi:arsenite/tail-anchored protein-transporting ATPase
VTLAAAFDRVAGRRVILFGGKGGVGKTTISIAAALHFSKSRPAILFTTDPASNLSDILHGELRTEALDASALYRRFLDRNLDSFLELGDRGTYLDKDELRRFFELSLPGVDELMAWMRIGELAEENPDATIIVDTAPTGHTLRMLSSADHFRQFAEALDSMQAKHRGMVRQFTRRNVRDAMDAFVDQFEADARRRRDLLTNPAYAAFVPVTLSEPWVVEQTERLIRDIRAEGIDVPFTILNRAVVDDDCDRGRDDAARTRLAPVVDAPRACAPLDTLWAIEEWSAWERGRLARMGRKAAGETPAVPGRLELARLTFLAGKGGVGKTTSAASIALQLAAQHPDKNYTVISVDPAHTLRDVFAHEPPPNNLTVETIDTRAKWRRFRDSLGEEIERAIGAITPGGMTVAYDADAMKKLVEIAPPGADELFAITRLADLVADDSQTAIIVDTAPTGHFLRLVDLPATAGEWVREFMRILLRYRELIPAGSLGEELIRASRALHALEEALRSDSARVIVVTRPERIVIAESKRLINEVAQRGMQIGGVIVNYVTPENDCACDQSLRGYEIEALAELGRDDVVMIERRDEPVTKLAGLTTLIPIRNVYSAARK